MHGSFRRLEPTEASDVRAPRPRSLTPNRTLVTRSETAVLVDRVDGSGPSQSGSGPAPQSVRLAAWAGSGGIGARSRAFDGDHASADQLRSQVRRLFQQELARSAAVGAAMHAAATTC